jgi:hypothetical protein
VIHAIGYHVEVGVQDCDLITSPRQLALKTVSLFWKSISG